MCYQISHATSNALLKVHFISCIHTPGNVGVSSKHVQFFSNYSNSMWFAITTTVKRTCGPAVRRGAVTKLPNI